MSPKFVKSEVYTLSASTPVSTVTVLLPFTALGDRYNSLLFYCLNTDAGDDVYFTVETSEDGTHGDVATQTVVIPAGGQGSIEVGPYLLRKYWRLSAHTVAPGYPAATVQWGIKGTDRFDRLR
jgi:hypothetical protein